MSSSSPAHGRSVSLTLGGCHNSTLSNRTERFAACGLAWAPHGPSGSTGLRTGLPGQVPTGTPGGEVGGLLLFGGLVLGIASAACDAGTRANSRLARVRKWTSAG